MLELLAGKVMPDEVRRVLPVQPIALPTNPQSMQWRASVYNFNAKGESAWV